MGAGQWPEGSPGSGDDHVFDDNPVPAGVGRPVHFRFRYGISSSAAGKGSGPDARDLTDVYAALDSRNRFAFLNRIQTAVRPETRTRRIEQLTPALAQGKTPYPPPTKKSGIRGVTVDSAAG